MNRNEIDILPHVRLLPMHAWIGARPRKTAMGAWAVYLPSLQTKLLHSVGGLQHCIYHRAPRRETVLAGKSSGTKRATGAEWKAVLTTPILKRVAENYICLQRLHAAGLGPEPLGLVVVPDYRAWFSRGPTFTAGYRVANLFDYPPKEPATEEELRAAGVIPDRSLASIREQINGYVSDLNSVVGALPVDADTEVADLTGRLESALKAARAQQ